ncbi:MAG TPA: hemerythrin domain-containing protein [Candidatus Manganitrophaceae bacterium]|nr:hemerythrin domain-containing protein [Candidatus Manganitrophaceae bacterium]
MKATQILKKDHQKVKDLIKKLKTAKRNQQELVNTIDQEVKIHSRCEEQIFYPAVRRFDSERVEESLREHQQVDSILEELKQLVEDGGETFKSKIEELEENILNHVEEEEGEMFPESERELKQDLQEMGTQIQELKEELQEEYSRRKAA